MSRSKLPLTQFLNRLPAWQVGAGSVIALGGIWLVDYVVTVNLGMSIFYVLPIACMTWYLSTRLGYFASGVGACLWLIAESRRATDDTNVLYALWNTSARLAFFVLVVFLLEELKVAYRQEQYLASIDTLTTLLNRRAFLEALEREIQRSRRFASPFTLVYLDVDNFKQVNDTLGHAAGDRLLQQIGIVLSQQVRVVDYQARLGGDEFAILMVQTHRAQASPVLQRLFTKLSELANSNLPIGFSMGAMTFASHLPETPDEALAAADSLMYEVKSKGKHQLVQKEYGGR